MRRFLLRPLEAFCRHTAGLVPQCERPGAGCGASELLLYFSVVDDVGTFQPVHF